MRVYTKAGKNEYYKGKYMQGTLVEEDDKPEDGEELELRGGESSWGGERRKTYREDGASRTLRGSGGRRRGWQWRQELLSGWNIKKARSKTCDVEGRGYSGGMEEEKGVAA